MIVEDFISNDPLSPVSMTAVCPDGLASKIESGLSNRPVVNTRVQIGTRYVTNAETFNPSVRTQCSFYACSQNCVEHVGRHWTDFNEI